MGIRMKSLDITLTMVTILLVMVMLCLVQAVSSPVIFQCLVRFNLFAEGSAGIKSAIIMIFSLGLITGCLLLFLFGRIIIKLFNQK